MKNPGACVFLFALLLLSLSQTPAYSTLSDPELDDESEFNYVEGSGKGPKDWWRLNGSWRVCKYGERQSPINLEGANAVLDPSLGLLNTVYWENEAILKNRGHDVMLGWADGAGSLYIDSTAFSLKQSHWHSPAEHEFDGWRPELEMHTVYQSPDNNIAVVGILYTYGPPDPFLAQLEEPLKRLAYEGKSNVTLGPVLPLKVERLEPYYRYMGSLTTPPCTEGVVWTVLAEVRTASYWQVQLLKDVVNDDMKNNARPVQPINGRWIRLSPNWGPYDKHPSS